MGSEISLLAVNMQDCPITGRDHSNFDLVPLVIVLPVRWTVSQNILVTKLPAYVGGRLRQVLYVVHLYGVATGCFCDCCEKVFAGPLFVCFENFRKNSQSINFHVLLLHKAPDLS